MIRLTDKEINAILGKNQDIRYSYSLKRIADNDSLWILSSNDGEILCILDEEKKVFPIWPFKEYAEKYIHALDKDSDYNVRKMSLEKFDDELIDPLCEKEMPIRLFPVSETDKGKIVSVNTFVEDLAVELEDYK